MNAQMEQSLQQCKELGPLKTEIWCGEDLVFWAGARQVMKESASRTSISRELLDIDVETGKQLLVAALKAQPLAPHKSHIRTGLTCTSMSLALNSDTQDCHITWITVIAAVLYSRRGTGIIIVCFCSWMWRAWNCYFHSDAWIWIHNTMIHTGQHTDCSLTSCVGHNGYTCF